MKPWMKSWAQRADMIAMMAYSRIDMTRSVDSWYFLWNGSLAKSRQLTYSHTRDNNSGAHANDALYLVFSIELTCPEDDPWMRIWISRHQMFGMMQYSTFTSEQRQQFWDLMWNGCKACKGEDPPLVHSEENNGRGDHWMDAIFVFVEVSGFPVRR